MSSLQRCRQLSFLNSRMIHNQQNRDDDCIHDVIIIGGGPSGLFLSSLLSSYGIDSQILFDKRPEEELLKHPQAHFINLRSMEILKAEMPNVYDGIKREMPDVSEWEGFHFGGSVMGSRGRRLGRVVHPVKEPLKAGESGSAVLAPTTNDGGVHASAISAKNNDDDDDDDDDESDIDNFISVCRPAHLAQNKFVSLLLNEAKQRHGGSGKCNLRYGEEVTAIEEIYPETQSKPIISIQTSHGQFYQTRYLIAADGVHSFARRSFGIPMMGTSTMQNLINVHFRTNPQLSDMLMRDSDQVAMLHFVYNSQLVGAFVCHDGRKGEWVLQIPFFPPYQTMDDFSADKVREMVWAGLGMDRHEASECDFDVLSIRPWTMSSLVAQSYVNKSNNLVLVGDAAHAFPPAGGFGMNTGLQDSHNLAWRLALLLHHSSNTSMTKSILAKYESDRKPIATQNAALSVRNYNRTLRIAKACYLDAQHPALLTTVLGSPPMSLLPLQTRQDMFRRLVRVAMMPLASLASSNSSLHATHIERNVQSILKSGGSLPLVFPKFEIGFSYDHDVLSKKEDGSNDTQGYYPRIKVGYRLPHVVLEVRKSLFPHTHDGWSVLETTSHQAGASSDSLFVTLTDISSQLRRVLSCKAPVFTVLIVGPLIASSLTSIKESVERVSKQKNTSLVMANILGDGHDVNESVITLIDSQQVVWKLMSEEPSYTVLNACNAIVIVRPDGHISSAEFVEEGNISSVVEKIISQGLESAVGDIL